MVELFACLAAIGIGGGLLLGWRHVQSLERALAEARRSSDRAGRARADFLAVMSHEMRTPLNGIIGMTGLMLDAATDDETQPVDRRSLRVIQDSAEHLLHQINDILDFSRLDAGRLELEETAFDIRSVVGSAVELMQPEARAKGLALEIDVAEDVPRRAAGDPGRLRQVLLNLVSNAEKFTQAGHVRIEVTRLPVPAQAGRGALRLGFTVSDTGIGMSPQALARIWDEFTQADSSISRRFGGTGLGLTISRRLVKQMGGEISVTSKLGAGTVFRFDVALRARRASDDGRGPPREAATPQGPIVVPAAAPSALRILVADDNATNRLVLSRMLIRQGHQVTEAVNGREAVATAASGAFDLVLMDVMMPELDGLAAAAQIRGLAAPQSQVKIIGLSADDRHASPLAYRAAGMDGFASKPINAKRLAAAIVAVFPDRPAQDAPAPSPATQPLPAENRVFDPAVLEGLSRAIGADAVGARVDLFLRGHARHLAGVRSLAEIDQTPQAAAASSAAAQALAEEAASLGLMRAARAALNVAELADQPRLANLERDLRHGAEELRSWRPLLPG